MYMKDIKENMASYTQTIADVAISSHNITHTFRKWLVWRICILILGVKGLKRMVGTRPIYRTRRSATCSFFFNITEPQTLTRRFVSTFLTKPFGIFPRPDLLHCEFYDLTSKHFPCVFSHIFIDYLAVCGVRPYWPTIAHHGLKSTAHTRNSLTRGRCVFLLKGSSSSSYEKKISFFQWRSQWWMLLERNKLRLAPAPSPQNTSHE